MEKNEVCKYFSKSEKNSVHKLTWDRGNGKLDCLVRFDGFDEKITLN